jgi:hypothetical protein
MEASLYLLCGTSGSARAFWLGPHDMGGCRRCRPVLRHPRPADLDASAKAGEARVETVEEEWLEARRRVNVRRFPDHASTLVARWNALAFVPDPVGLLQEIHRVLEPGGRWVLGPSLEVHARREG